jgi:hypothetical protein
VVVNANEDHLPACATLFSTPVAVDAMPDSFDPSQLLRVDMKQIAWSSVLVPPRRIGRFLEPPDPTDSLRLQVLRNGRDRDSNLLGDLPARLPTMSELHHATNEFPRRLTWQALRSAAAVFQTLVTTFPETIQPLMCGLPAHAGGTSCLRYRPTETINPID